MRLSSALMFAGLSAIASASESPAAADNRVQRVAYDPSAVIDLVFCVGFQTTISFGEGEVIENVAVGDASRFQAIANRHATALFIKPTVEAARSNMTVLTTSRNYNFDLKVMTAERCPTTQAIYSLSFDYPSEPLRLAETPAGQPSVVVDPKEAAEATSKEPHPKDADSQLPEAKAPSRPHNTGYSFEGDAANVPLRVFDDGRTTYFQWAEGASAPAIYAIDPAGAKALVNYTFAGDKIAVDQIAPQFELRRGKAVTHLFNDGYAAPALDGASPRPRKAQRRRFLGLF